MSHIFELERHVFEARIWPDTPGVCRRSYSLVQLSGPPLTQSQWDAIAAVFIADLKEAGARVHGWEFLTSPRPGDHS